MLTDKCEFFGYLEVLKCNGYIGFNADENFVFTDLFSRTHFHIKYLKFINNKMLILSYFFI